MSSCCVQSYLSSLQFQLLMIFSQGLKDLELNAHQRCEGSKVEHELELTLGRSQKATLDFKQLLCCLIQIILYHQYIDLFTS